MLAPGVILNNRYRLDERIATGGMGEVWRGTDVLLHRGVAVKALLPTLMSDSEFITRFRTEARMMAALRHPGIVQVYDYGEDAMVGGSRLDYLVMEYVAGTPLSQRVQQAGKLGVAETMGIVAQAADALQVAHEAGIVHRDVKPSNLLVRPGGAVVLVDFGVARSVGVTGITSTNVVLGSVHYMAPEQAEGKPVSAATDVYALGAVAYCCLTGRPPYPGDNPLQVLSQLVLGEPPTLPVELPAVASALVLRALDKDPARRYPSAAALADAARSAQNTAAVPAYRGTPYGKPAVAPAPPAPTRPAPRNRLRNTTIAVSAAVAVAALVGVVALVAFRPDPSSAEVQLPIGARGGGPAAGGGPGGAPDRAEGAPAWPAAPLTSGSAGPSRSRVKAPAPTASKPAGEPTATTATPTVAPTTTGAATNPYKPKQVCGSGFTVIDQAPLKGSDGTLLGRVYLLYNSTTGRNCTTTLKVTAVGAATATSAYLEVQGGSRVTDSGAFEYYAGPVRAKAVATCVKWGGSAGGVSYDSPFEHCS